MYSALSFSVSLPSFSTFFFSSSKRECGKKDDENKNGKIWTNQLPQKIFLENRQKILTIFLFPSWSERPNTSFMMFTNYYLHPVNECYQDHRNCSLLQPTSFQEWSCLESKGVILAILGTLPQVQKEGACWSRKLILVPEQNDRSCWKRSFRKHNTFMKHEVLKFIKFIKHEVILKYFKTSWMFTKLMM